MRLSGRCLCKCRAGADSGQPTAGAILFFTAGPIEAAVSNQALGFVVPKGRERSISYGTYEWAMDVLESAVSQSEYLLGDAFSAVDIYAGSSLGFAMPTGSIETRPVFEAYGSRISARPAAVRAQQIDNALISRKSPAA